VLKYQKINTENEVVMPIISRPKPGQAVPIDTMLALGYTKNTKLTPAEVREGICAGLSQLCAQSVAVGKYAEHDARLTLLKSPTFLQEMKTVQAKLEEKTKMLEEAVAPVDALLKALHSRLEVTEQRMKKPVEKSVLSQMSEAKEDVMLALRLLLDQRKEAYQKARAQAEEKFPLTVDDQKYLAILQMYDGVNLFQFPEAYKELFFEEPAKGSLPQTEVETVAKVSEMIGSLDLQAQGGLQMRMQEKGQYSEEALTQLLEDYRVAILAVYNNLIEEEKKIKLGTNPTAKKTIEAKINVKKEELARVPIICRAGKHRTCSWFEPATDTWTVRDPEQDEIKVKREQHGNVASEMMFAHVVSPPAKIDFEMRFYTTGNNDAVAEIKKHIAEIRAKRQVEVEARATEAEAKKAKEINMLPEVISKEEAPLSIKPTYSTSLPRLDLSWFFSSESDEPESPKSAKKGMSKNFFSSSESEGVKLRKYIQTLTIEDTPMDVDPLADGAVINRRNQL
jgi:hypothetical protein